MHFEVVNNLNFFFRKCLQQWKLHNYLFSSAARSCGAKEIENEICQYRLKGKLWYLFNVNEVMSHALVYGISDAFTLGATDKWQERLLKHRRRAANVEDKCVLMVVQFETIGNFLIVPANLK